MEPGQYQMTLRRIEIRGEVSDQVKRSVNSDGSDAVESETHCYRVRGADGRHLSLLESFFEQGGDGVNYSDTRVDGEQASGEASMTEGDLRGRARYAGRFQPTFAQFTLEVEMQDKDMQRPMIVVSEVTMTRLGETCEDSLSRIGDR